MFIIYIICKGSLSFHIQTEANSILILTFENVVLIFG